MHHSYCIHAKRIVAAAYEYFLTFYLGWDSVDRMNVTIFCYRLTCTNIYNSRSMPFALPASIVLDLAKKKENNFNVICCEDATICAISCSHFTWNWSARNKCANQIWVSVFSLDFFIELNFAFKIEHRTATCETNRLRIEEMKEKNQRFSHSN